MTNVIDVAASQTSYRHTLSEAGLNGTLCVDLVWKRLMSRIWFGEVRLHTHIMVCIALKAHIAAYGVPDSCPVPHVFVLALSLSGPMYCKNDA